MNITKKFIIDSQTGIEAIEAALTEQQHELAELKKYIRYLEKLFIENFEANKYSDFTYHAFMNAHDIDGVYEPELVDSEKQIWKRWCGDTQRGIKFTHPCKPYTTYQFKIELCDTHLLTQKSRFILNCNNFECAPTKVASNILEFKFFTGAKTKMELHLEVIGEIAPVPSDDRELAFSFYNFSVSAIGAE